MVKKVSKDTAVPKPLRLLCHQASRLHQLHATSSLVSLLAFWRFWPTAIMAETWTFLLKVLWCIGLGRRESCRNARGVRAQLLSRVWSPLLSCWSQSCRVSFRCHSSALHRCFACHDTLWHVCQTRNWHGAIAIPAVHFEEQWKPLQFSDTLQDRETAVVTDRTYGTIHKHHQCANVTHHSTSRVITTCYVLVFEEWKLPFGSTDKHECHVDLVETVPVHQSFIIFAATPDWHIFIVRLCMNSDWDYSPSLYAKVSTVAIVTVLAVMIDEVFTMLPTLTSLALHPQYQWLHIAGCGLSKYELRIL